MWKACNFARLSRISSNFPFRKMLQSIGWDVGCDSRILGEWRHPKHEVTVSWMLAPFIFNPYQFRPSCWINDIKALTVVYRVLLWFHGTLCLKKGLEKHGCQCWCWHSNFTWKLGGLDAFLPWRWWHALEEAPCLELWRHVGEWYLDFMDSVYLSMVFIGFLVSWMASIFPDMIREVFLDDIIST